MTPERLVEFAVRLSALLGEYIEADTLEERLVNDLCCSAVLMDCGEAGAGQCNQIGHELLTPAANKGVSITAQRIYDAHKPLLGPALDERRRDAAEGAQA